MIFLPNSRLWNKAGKTVFLLLAFFLPLCFFIQLEDCFELSETLVLLWGMTLWAALSYGRPFSLGQGRARWAYGSFLVFWFLGLVSFLILRSKIYFYFPTQNYLWVLGAFALFAPLPEGLLKFRFYGVICLSALLGSFYSFAQALGFDLPGWSTDFAHRSFSTMGNPIFWAGFLLIALPLALQLTVEGHRGGKRIFWIFLVLVLALSLAATQTRGAWIAFGIELLVMAFFMGWRSPVFKYFAAGLLIFMVVLFAYEPFRARVFSIGAVQSEDARGRYFLWGTAVEPWKEAPWMGQGPGGYAAGFPQTQARLAQEDPRRAYWNVVHAHNDYLEILAERGVVGSLFGFFFFGGVLWDRWKRAWAQRPKLTGDLAELSILLGFSFYAFFHFPFSIVPIAASLAFLFNPGWEMKGGEREKAGKVQKWIGIGVILPLLGGCALSLNVLSQNIKLHQAIDLTAQRRPDQAIQLLGPKGEPGLLHYWDPRVSWAQANAYEVMGLPSQAAQALAEASRVYPGDSEIFAALCKFYGQMNQVPQARAAGEKALELFPNQEDALNNLAMLSYLQKNLSGAVEFLDRLASAQEARGETQEAAQTRQKIKALTQK